MGKYYLGLDGGSTYLKAALMKDGKVVRHSFQPCEYGKPCTSVSCDNGGAFKEDEQGDSSCGEMVSACGISAAYGYALYFV